MNVFYLNNADCLNTIKYRSRFRLLSDVADYIVDAIPADFLITLLVLRGLRIARWPVATIRPMRDRARFCVTQPR